MSLKVAQLGKIKEMKVEIKKKLTVPKKTVLREIFNNLTKVKGGLITDNV